DDVLERAWPVPVRAEDIPTSAGTVRIYRAGPDGDDPYVLLTGAGGNALAWHRWMDRLGDRPVIAVDPLGEPGHSVQTAPVSPRGLRRRAARWLNNATLADDDMIRIMRAGVGFRRPVTPVPVFTDEELAAVGVPVQALFGGGPSSLQPANPERAGTVCPGWRVEVFP